MKNNIAIVEIDERTAWTLARLAAGRAANDVPLDSLEPAWSRIAANIASNRNGKSASRILTEELKKHFPRDCERLLKQIQKVDYTTPAPTLDAWRAFTLADAYAKRPALEFVVSGLFACPSLNILYGPPGALKSLLLADCCAAIASGDAWLPSLPNARASGFVTTQNAVMWIDFDNGVRRTHERFEAIGRARNLSDTTPIFYYSMPSPWLDASSKNAINDLTERVQKRNARMIVIDNLGVVTGEADENKAEIAHVMANLRGIAETTQSAIVLFHHQRKSTAANTRAGEALRGHSSIEAALDLALLVERADRAETIALKATKSRGADVPPFGAHFTFEHKPNSRELKTAKFFGVEIEDKNSPRAIERAVLEIVDAQRGLNQTELVKRVQQKTDVGVNKIRAAIEQLETNEKLKTAKGERGAKIYELGTRA